MSDAGKTAKKGKGKTVLCGANAYEKKYYFNEAFRVIPQSIQDELHIICVLFTEEAGGVFTIAFEADGSVVMETDFAEDDFLYDEIGSGLLVREVSRNRQEMFEALSLYYRIFILHEELDVEKDGTGIGAERPGNSNDISN